MQNNKSRFVERKGKPVEEEKLFDGFLMSKYFLMRHCLSHGGLSFEEKDGIPQLVMDGEYHRLFVENNRIVIEDLDTQYEGYWGDSEWNYDLK